MGGSQEKSGTRFYHLVENVCILLDVSSRMKMKIFKLVRQQTLNTSTKYFVVIALEKCRVSVCHEFPKVVHGR